MATRWVIGLASGSSLDGVDAALVEVSGSGLDLHARLAEAVQQPYPAELAELIREQTQPGAGIHRLSLLHRLMGETFAAAARGVADRASLSLQQVQCVGCPGHTLWHDADGRFPHALTVGMPAVLAERLGVTVCSDFRGRDLAAGGQGAPLAALADYLLFRHPQEGRLLLHLGGVARLVHVPAGARLTEVRGFEAGPCSVLLDALMRLLTSGRESYDTGGRHAVQGRCLEPLLREWLRHPYLLRRPPKSLPRSAFTEEFAAQAVAQARAHNGTLHDLLCTATHFVARSVSESLARFLPPGRVDRVLVSGGAVRNGMLWQLLQQQLAPAVVERTDAAGLPAAYRKAMAFALLAVLLVDGVAANLPAVTGAAGSRLLGTLTPGAPGHWARCLAWMAAQTAPLAIAEEAE